MGYGENRAHRGHSTVNLNDYRINAAPNLSWVQLRFSCAYHARLLAADETYLVARRRGVKNTPQFSVENVLNDQNWSENFVRIPISGSLKTRSRPDFEFISAYRDEMSKRFGISRITSGYRDPLSRVPFYIKEDATREYHQKNQELIEQPEEP